MIHNIPNPDSLRDVSVYYLNHAWVIAFDVYSYVNESSAGDDTLKEELLEDSKKLLNTSLMLLSQSIELYLKYEIASVNPFLIVSNIEKSKENADFSDLKTVSASDLIKVRKRVCDELLHPDVENEFDQIRKLRNKSMHLGISTIEDEMSILEKIIIISEILFSENFLEVRKDFLWSIIYTDSAATKDSLIHEANSILCDFDDAIVESYLGDKLDHFVEKCCCDQKTVIKTDKESKQCIVCDSEYDDCLK